MYMQEYAESVQIATTCELSCTPCRKIIVADKNLARILKAAMKFIDTQNSGNVNYVNVYMQ